MAGGQRRFEAETRRQRDQRGVSGGWPRIWLHTYQGARLVAMRRLRLEEWPVDGSKLSDYEAQDMTLRRQGREDAAHGAGDG